MALSSFLRLKGVLRICFRKNIPRSFQLIHRKSTAENETKVLVKTTVTTFKDVQQINGLDVTFSNAEEAFRSKKTWELVRALAVFNLCSVNFLVDNNREIFKWSPRIFGKTLFTKLMKVTFYGHFVAGEDQNAIRPLVHKNLQYGVKSILDYSVEVDLSSQQTEEAETKGCVSENQAPVDDLDRGIKQIKASHEFLDRRDEVVSTRTYCYEDEVTYDENMKAFLRSVDAAAGSAQKTGFIAIKLTALCRPELLMRLSNVLISTRKIFKTLAGEQDILLHKFREKDFYKSLNELGLPISRDAANTWFSILDITYDKEVDLWDWDNLLDANLSIFKLLAIPHTAKGLQESTAQELTEEEDLYMQSMISRLNKIGEYASENGVRVMIDAEQTYFQPAISRLTIEMMRKFNKDKAVIFNTYQTYLKSALTTLKIDLELSRREKFYFGAKLVRGAYMEQERERAAAIGYVDPINPTYEATTAMYHSCLEEVFRHVKHRSLGEIAVMAATHNEDTVRYAVESMEQHGIKPSDKIICFGQLLGMCDQISFPLGQSGYSVYKYVPYGPVEEVLPYLSRRALENRGILKKVQKEKSLLWTEIKRRIKTGQVRYDPLRSGPSE